MTRVLLATIGILAAIGACSSFGGEASSSIASDGGDEDPSPPDSGVADGLQEAADAADAMPLTADTVVVDLDASVKYRIDRKEVTYGQFAAFIAAVGQDAGFNAIAGCEYKHLPGPDQPCLQSSSISEQPIRCVDWCDAFAYCKFVGKHLCGRVGGGRSSYTDDEKVSIASEWVRACSGDILLGERFPYGTSFDSSACNTDGSIDGGKIASVGAFPKCVGGVPSLLDMSGNVEEWVNSCQSFSNGPNDNCVVHGGSYTAPAKTCASVDAAQRGDYRPYRGFRCCAD